MIRDIHNLIIEQTFYMQLMFVETLSSSRSINIYMMNIYLFFGYLTLLHLKFNPWRLIWIKTSLIDRRLYLLMALSINYMHKHIKLSSLTKNKIVESITGIAFFFSALHFYCIFWYGYQGLRQKGSNRCPNNFEKKIKINK